MSILKLPGDNFYLTSLLLRCEETTQQETSRRPQSQSKILTVYERWVLLSSFAFATSLTMNLDDRLSDNNKQQSLLPEEKPMRYFFSADAVSSSNEYPNIFEEAKDMLLSAILIYGMIDLRTLARQQSLLSSTGQQDNYLVDQLLSLPIAAKDVVRLVAQHQIAIGCEIGSESTELYLDAFRKIQSTSSSHELELDFTKQGQIALVGFDVVVVDDEHSDSELVYSVCLDTARRRITVLFRGCSTRKDWGICANNFLSARDNPLYDDAEMNYDKRLPSTVGIHSGYSQYLFTPNERTGVSKYETIVRQVQSLLKDYPGYHVYVTGHSLGAALSTVFAFQAAATRQLAIVTCINFASPMVGNLDFETAFQSLEAQGRIRCLRVTNHFDIFTQLPDRGNWLYVMACCYWPGIHLIFYVGWSFIFFLCCQTRVYRHVGMDLHMYRQWSFSEKLFCLTAADNTIEYSYKVKHSKGTPQSFAWRVAHDWKKHLKQTLQRIMAIPFVVDFNTNHSVQEHLRRLSGLASELEHVYLKELYDTRRFPTGTSPSNKV